MSVAVTQESRAITEMRLPSPADLGLIKLSHCDNTHVGPKLNCNGNLTLNQYLNVSDTKLNLRDLKKGLDGLLSTDSAISPNWKQKCFKLKYLWLSLILVVIISVGACSLLFSPTKKENDIDLPYNYTLRLRTRPEWYSKPELNCKDLTIRPARYVIVTESGSTSCNQPIFCEHIIKALQNYNLKQGSCDIRYNFLIAGDGYIYEGIGWGKYGSHTHGFNCDGIGVAFLGDYDILHLTSEMIEAFNLLIEEGLKLKEIDPNYKLFAQNQVVSFNSPGVNIVEEIKKWKGWSEAKKEDRMCI